MISPSATTYTNLLSPSVVLTARTPTSTQSRHYLTGLLKTDEVRSQLAANLSFYASPTSFSAAQERSNHNVGIVSPSQGVNRSLPSQYVRKSNNHSLTDRINHVDDQSLNKICESYKENLMQGIKEFQSQVQRNGRKEASLSHGNNSTMRPTVREFSQEKTDNITSKLDALAKTNAKILMENTDLKQRSDALEQTNKELQDRMHDMLKHLERLDEDKKKDQFNKMHPSIQAAKKNYDNIKNETNSYTNQCTSLKPLQRVSDNASGKEIENHKLVRVTKPDSKATQVSAYNLEMMATQSDQFEEQKRDKILQELCKIYGVTDPSELINCALKTEKIIRAVPLMEKLLAEVQHTVYSNQKISNTQEKFDNLVGALKRIKSESELSQELLEFRMKVAGLLGCAKTNTNNDYILEALERSLKNVSNSRKIDQYETIYDDTELANIASSRGDSKHQNNLERLELFKRLFKVNDTEASSKLNYIYRHQAEFQNFKKVMSTFWEIEESISSELFMKLMMDITEQRQFFKK